MNRLLALDAATTTGWALYDGKGNLEAHGKFKVVGEGFNKYLSMKENIEALVALYKPSHCILEDCQAQGNMNTYKVLSAYQGVIVSTLLAYEVEVETVYVSSWRSTVQLRASGRENQKQAAQKMVEQLYGIRPSQDECEAILIGKSKFMKELNWE